MSKYLPARIVLLVAILGANVGLVYFIVVDRSKKTYTVGASRLGPSPDINATELVLGSECGSNLSTHFADYLQTVLYLRICKKLCLDKGTRKLGYKLVFSIILIILIFTILANAFAQSHDQAAIVLQVVGCFFSHIFASLFRSGFLVAGKTFCLSCDREELGVC